MTTLEILLKYVKNELNLDVMKKKRYLDFVNLYINAHTVGLLLYLLEILYQIADKFFYSRVT